LYRPNEKHLLPGHLEFPVTRLVAFGRSRQPDAVSPRRMIAFWAFENCDAFIALRSLPANPPGCGKP
jgi:hypothetical protein